MISCAFNDALYREYIAKETGRLTDSMVPMIEMTIRSSIRVKPF